MFGLGKSKKVKRKGAKKSAPWWPQFSAEGRGKVLRVGGWLSLIAAVFWGGAVAVGRLDAHVTRGLLSRVPNASVYFSDMPLSMTELAQDELRSSVANLLTHNWTDATLCRKIAARLTASGWIGKLNHVRLTGDGRFEVSAVYREPIAMMQQRSTFFLIDAEAVRLPGTYLFDPTWKLIQGVAAPAPSPGAAWSGQDARAAVSLVQAIDREQFRHQVTGVIVENFGGRRDRRRSHIELATDRAAGSRIRWGSAIGYEIEENTAAQKLAILRANYRTTGRADAGHPIIDVSTFADRFTVPG